MALTVTVLQNSYKEAFVKITSTGTGTAVLTLESLCYRNGVQFLEAYPASANKPYQVEIRTLQWCGKNGSVLECTRNGDTIFTIMPECGGTMQFTGELGYNDSTNAEDDFTFTATGDTPMQAWMVIRKNNYRSMHEDARDKIAGDTE